MTKFIELHSLYYKTPIFVNVDSIAYIEEGYRGLSIYLRCQAISSHEKGGMVDKIEGVLKHLEVTESYAKVKSLIEE